MVLDARRRWRIFMVIFVWGATIYFGAYRAPDDATVIYVVGKQWMWKFQHPEGQREINELHVPSGRPFKLMLTSEDVIHSFFVPDFRIHMDVLPDRYTIGLVPGRPGRATYHLFCSQYCGTNHAGMIGTVIVMEPADYQNWLHLHAEGSLALEGRKVFLKYRCISCHSADEHARAPVLEDLFGKSRSSLRDGRRRCIADEDYIRESILDPGAKIVAGWREHHADLQGPGERGGDHRADRLHSSRWSGGRRRRRVEDYPPPVDHAPHQPASSRPDHEHRNPGTARRFRRRRRASRRETYLNVGLRRRCPGC